jgi:hypothetical protein
MLCCILIALFGPVGLTLAARSGTPVAACCRRYPLIPLAWGVAFLGVGASCIWLIWLWRTGADMPAAFRHLCQVSNWVR